MLVMMGVLEDGTKELIAVYDGHQESKESWLEVLRDLKQRGLKQGPQLAVGDGALGFWAALEEEYPGTGHQRCWVHKTANILDKLPKRVQPQAKKMIHEMYLAPTKTDAQQACQAFLDHYQAKYPKRPPSVCKRMRKCCLPSMTTRPNTGRIYAARTRSSRPLRRCVTAPGKPKAAVPGWPR
jgi:transposase-like protein